MRFLIVNVTETVHAELIAGGVVAVGVATTFVLVMPLAGGGGEMN